MSEDTSLEHGVLFNNAARRLFEQIAALMELESWFDPCNGREGGDTWAKRMERAGRRFP